MKVYLDNASTTSVSKEVLDVMLPFFKEEYGNPSSLHKAGIKNKRVVNDSRTKIAGLLNCQRSEVFFTSCGTESTNWAIKGIAANNRTKSDIITTRVEHHATLNTCKYLESRGYTLLFVDVDNQGFIDLDKDSPYAKDEQKRRIRDKHIFDIGIGYNIQHGKDKKNANSMYFVDSHAIVPPYISNDKQEDLTKYQRYIM